jgi:ATP-dependent exoDNAse (exonuclease V) beta subunit
MRCEERDGKRVLIEGVIDAVGSTDSGMSIVDWKTDDVDESAWKSRVAGYESQIGAYRDILAVLSGAEVTASLERLVVVEGR